MSINEVDNIRDIQQQVIRANQLAHDKGACFHMKSVPYISSKIVRAYCWDIISREINNAAIQIQNAHVLEVGCGTGTWAEMFMENGAALYDGVDVSPGMLEIARSLNKDERVKFYECSLENYAVTHKEQYDIIVSSSFLHHLTDLEIGLHSLKSMLRSGGIYVAHHEIIKSRQATIIEKFDDYISKLYGYQGCCEYGLINRLFRVTSLPILYRFKNIFLKRERECNMIDYQLNFDFDLSKDPIALKYGKTIPYSYFNFMFFLQFSKPMNYHIFAMKKM
jgi:2-polyprenyl-3-methyl-5-hydroxy-6-metoxy-1,4-benzoquinol methylase